MTDNVYKAPESDLEGPKAPVWTDVKTPKVIYLPAVLIFFYLASQLSVLKRALGVDASAAAGTAASAILMIYAIAALLLPAGIARLNRLALVLGALVMGIGAALMFLKIGVGLFGGTVGGVVWVALVMAILLSISTWICIRPSTLEASATRSEFKRQQAMTRYVAKNLSKTK